MNERLNTQKEQFIATLIREADKYYEELSRGSADPTFDINDFERATVKSRKRVDDIFITALGEAASSVESESKKNVLNAEEH